ncbi:hypothetical protein J2P12_00275 [Candidatus Bathyarchaeota archaeon]|nr:hypothetical protein [Candidatus Bathyarchaeota archaeon]
MIETFHTTLNKCFLTVTENMLGSAVRSEVCRLLERNGVSLNEIALRFDEVVEILTRSFGQSARVLVYKTVTSLYDEYSLRAGFGFYDSLKDQIAMLKNKVVSDLLKPRHSLSIDESIYVATRQNAVR